MLDHSHFETNVMGFSIISSNSMSSSLERSIFKVYLTNYPCNCLGFGRIGLGVFHFGLGCHTPVAGLSY